MPGEINWERLDSESRIDVRADDIDSFIAAVLGTIDEEAARSSPRRWELVCRYFAGCAAAAMVQGRTPRGGAKRIADYLAENFPTEEDEFEKKSNDGFFEFMDWLAKPGSFRPTALRAAIER